MRVKNIDTVSETYEGMFLTASQEYTLEANEIGRWANSNKVLDSISSGKLQIGNDAQWITGTSNQIMELTGKTIKDNDGRQLVSSTAFSSKYINGGSLFKRVHGVNATISANSTESIDIVIPYNTVKFSGAEIIGCSLKDTVNFTVHDTPTNTASGLDVPTYGANVQINKFGYSVEMKEGSYTNASNYDADLIKDMILRCSYTNNSASEVYIAVNFELHEVK